MSDPLPKHPTSPRLASPSATEIPAGYRDPDAMFRRIVAQHEGLLTARLRGRSGLLPESAKDLRQRVLLALLLHLRAGKPIENVEGFLAAIVTGERRNHRRLFRHRIEGGLDAEAEVSPARGTEEAVAREELRAKVQRHLGELTPEQAEVVRVVDLEGLSITKAAQRLGRPWGTVASQHKAARARLKELAASSERAGGRRGKGRR